MPARAFDGEGARLHGGRWNSPGTRVAYASDSIALAALEVLAHLQSTSVLQSYSLATILSRKSWLRRSSRPRSVKAGGAIPRLPKIRHSATGGLRRGARSCCECQAR